ncbi:hypothetical protein [Sediminibacillus halophilus]|uniref:Uncharacterized protein n=1 Tax=Sediminibacillus halophilus TaxID=482461 RepID=A0A1G9W6F0_9BACI|nr:hypothetical protein [Sediminibacillus halophilus]SDM79893.1 hypothetical protein SAMN05216244_3440 [Sediminibacillus halophilus]
MTRHEEQQQEPFNDVIEHLQTIEGYRVGKGKRKLPKPIRLIGYFLFAGVICMIIFGIIGSLLNG